MYDVFAEIGTIRYIKAKFEIKADAESYAISKKIEFPATKWSIEWTERWIVSDDRTPILFKDYHVLSKDYA